MHIITSAKNVIFIRCLVYLKNLVSWADLEHSLRYTFRDRLRAVETPLEAIDQLGGWSSVKTIGSSYGRGYSVEHLRKYLDAICI